MFYLTTHVSVTQTQMCKKCLPVVSWDEYQLTHWSRVTHICFSKLTIIGSDDGLLPGRHQAIIWTNAGILLIGPLRTNFSEILIEIYTFSFTEMLRSSGSIANTDTMSKNIRQWFNARGFSYSHWCLIQLRCAAVAFDHTFLVLDLSSNMHPSDSFISHYTGSVIVPYFTVSRTVPDLLVFQPDNLAAHEPVNAFSDMSWFNNSLGPRDSYIYASVN